MRTMQVNCTVPYFLLAAENEKHVFVAFPFQRFKRKIHMGPMHSKITFLYYQMAADCVLNKTQPQPHRQSKSLFAVLCFIRGSKIL